MESATLHSTMFLLIQKTGSATITATYLFTFHDVSINTLLLPLLQFQTLHSTMFLLIQSSNLVFSSCRICFTFHDVSINTSTVRRWKSTQNLYIPRCFYLYMSRMTNWSMEIHFTFHDVSINTTLCRLPTAVIHPLHSTMFLLIPVIL